MENKKPEVKLINESGSSKTKERKQKQTVKKRKKERKFGNQIFNFDEDSFCEFAYLYTFVNYIILFNGSLVCLTK